MNELTGRTVVITGGAGGIGRALAARFGRAGARIVLLDQESSGLDAAVAQLSERGIATVSAVCDVTDFDSCRQVLAEVGDIDVLINNAGIPQRSAFFDTDIDVFRRVMNVNFFGSLYCAKAALPALERSGGTIVTISSIAGVAPLFGRSGYAASKHALHGLFETARSELRERGIHVLLVCPGFTASGFEKRALGADGTVTDRPRTSVGRIDSTEVVAERIFRATLARKRLLVLSAVGKLSYFLSRLAPAVLDHLQRRRLEAEIVAG